ncbi:uncharacterized protein LOC101853003 [Aplysia californica]|uniref:Uncharacterized protein LOC101853003 n=1 Tax=Aplysia californica TaxID=6500 RepID=A0ABM0JQV1_APLCA|nr:uncharacterized protein LOC101853003 [Aplysia californica]
MADILDLPTKTVWFAVKRLDLNDTEPSDVISLQMNEEEKVTEVTQSLRSILQLNNADLILRLRNSRGSIIPLNGKLCMTASSFTSPFTLEVVRHFQSVEPAPNSLELTQYAESLKERVMDVQDRINTLESTMENMQEMRHDKIYQEISKLENTVNFLTRRIEEAEMIEWRGMFVKNPLW